MSKEHNPPPGPIMLQLAPLPRTQIGPFLILGVEKDAGREAIEAAWAERVKWARRGTAKVALEDVNWAREMLNGAESRIRCDAISFNIDTTAGTIQQLKARFQGPRAGEVGARPLDAEKWLADYAPPTPVPTLEELRELVRPPELPRDVPAVRVVLENFARPPVDPWQIDLDA